MLSERLHFRLAGDVRFCVSGGFVEQFLRACRDHGVCLRHTKTQQTSLTGSVGRGDIEKLKLAAKQSGMQLQILKKQGLAFVLQRYRLRVGIPVGLCLALVLFGILSSFVWQVDVTGCETLSEEYIRTYFEELGVRPGVLQSSIDILRCRDRALLDIKELLWATVYLKGCTACIEISERKGQTQLPAMQSSNLIASYGGEIVRADVYAGESYIKRGQAVAKGDLLVGGVITLKNGGVRFVCSKADIVARTNRTLETVVLLNEEVPTICKSKVRYLLYWFNLRIPLLTVTAKSPAEQAQTMWVYDNIIFPVGIIRQGVRKIQSCAIQKTQQFALLCCFAEYAAQEIQTMQDKYILQRSLTVYFEDGKIRVQGEYICEENIVCEQELQIDTEK